MIIKKETKNGIAIYTVEKDYDDDKMSGQMNKFIKPEQIKNIIRDDADVYTEDGKLLLLFRKNKLSKENIDTFYDNIVDFARNVTTNRGNASGSKNPSNMRENPKVMSNIFGYFDRWSPAQKFIFKNKHMHPSIDVRECRFNMNNPEKYKKTFPLIKEIDKFYEKYTPDKYKLQRRKANQTYFKIPDTAFTTVTTNINYQTTIHTDKGDDDEGFGNLAVIEHGDYKGGETCFPQYGVGVDVRTGDVLYMDVHQPHANLPIKKDSEDAVRLSIVCYLRKQVWLKTKNRTYKFRERHNKTVKRILKKN